MLFLNIKNVVSYLDFEYTYLRSGAMQVVFINEYKSSEISSQMFSNVMFSKIFKNKRRTGYGINFAK